MRSLLALTVIWFVAVHEARAASHDVPLRFDVIVNAANPVTEISVVKLREILMGNVREWPNHRRITVVQREAQNPTIAMVLKAVLGFSSRDYTRYLLHLEFKGGEAVQLKTLLSDEGACEYVHNAPGALAFLSGETLSALPCGRQVRVVPLLESASPLEPGGSALKFTFVQLYTSVRARWRETSLIVVGVIALFSAVLAAFDLMQALKNGEMVYSVSVSGLSIEGELQGYTQESRRVLLYALTTTDPNLQLPYVKAARVADAEVTRLHRLFAQIALSQSAKTLLATLRADWTRYENVRDEIIGLILEDRTAEALLLEKTQAGPLFDTCASRLRELKLMLDEFAKHQLVEIRRTYYRCAAEVVFLILTMVLFIASVRMLSVLRRNNLHLSQAEILERHRSRILESINQNTELAQIFSDIASLVEQSLPAGFLARILTSQTADLLGVRVLHVPIPGNKGSPSGTLEVYAPGN